jgi:NAD(P)-dependent dehydrogenase (short-subunit alcohol dehydrogenase family)
MRVAIVTGASSGIGQSAAIQIAKRGTGVILTYHGNQSGALDVVATIERDGGRAVALRLDVGHSETFPAFRESVVASIERSWVAHGLRARE